MVEPAGLERGLRRRTYHSPKDPTGAPSTEQLPPSVSRQTLPLQDILDDIILRPHARAVDRRTVSLKRRQHFVCFFIPALPHQQSRGIWQEWTHRINAQREKDLKGQRKPPRHGTLREGKP